MLGLVFVSLPFKHILLFLMFFLNKIKNREKDAEFYFSFDSFQILHVFLPDILVHWALID
jgi:hypothetical protein